MKTKDIVLEYINTYQENKPIFIEDIKLYAMNSAERKNKERIKSNIYVIIHRLVKSRILEPKCRGVYYKPGNTVFGKSTIGISELIERKYLRDKEGNINGYVIGAKIYNRLGLTTQVPNVTDIVTNKCKYNNIYKKNLRVNIHKPKIPIDNNNYLYLQLLDILENKDNINIEVGLDFYYKTIQEIINNNNLNYGKLINYAQITKNKKALDAFYNFKEKVLK